MFRTKFYETLHLSRSDGERVPKDVTHMDGSVIIIKEWVFDECKYIVSAVIGDKVTKLKPGPSRIAMSVIRSAFHNAGNH